MREKHTKEPIPEHWDWGCAGIFVETQGTHGYCGFEPGLPFTSKPGCRGEHAGPPGPPAPELGAQGTLRQNIDTTDKRGSWGDLGLAVLLVSAEPDRPALSAWPGPFRLTLRRWGKPLCFLGGQWRGQSAGRAQTAPRSCPAHVTRLPATGPLGLSFCSSRMDVMVAASSERLL